MKPLSLLACTAALALPACLVTVGDDGMDVHGWDEWGDVLGSQHSQFAMDGRQVDIDDDDVSVDGVRLRHQRWVDLAQPATPGAALEVAVGSGPVMLDASPGELSLSVLLFSEHEGDGSVALEEGRLLAREGTGKVFINAVRGRVPADTRVRASSGTGDIQLSGFSGASLWASSGTGALRVMDCDVRLVEAETGTGDLAVLSGAPQEVRVASGTGDVHLDGVHADAVHAATGTGDISIRLCAIGRLQADSGTGDVTLHGGSVRELHHELGTGELSIAGGTALGG